MGSFQYSWMVGPVPAAALGCSRLSLSPAWRGLGNALTGRCAGSGDRLILVSFVLTVPDAEGSVVITNTAAGKWYLYGGAISADVVGWS